MESEDPLSIFLYALKASETRRQYPRRLKFFFDILRLQGSLERQAKEFIARVRQEPEWAQTSFMRFVTLQKERASLDDDLDG